MAARNPKYNNSIPEKNVYSSTRTTSRSPSGTTTRSPSRTSTRSTTRTITGAPSRTSISSSSRTTTRSPTRTATSSSSRTTITSSKTQAISVDDDTRNHVIGGSSMYDVDMDLMERYVEATNNPSNIDNIQYLYDYFTHHLLYAFDEFVSYVASDKLISADFEKLDAYIGTPPTNPFERVVKSGVLDSTSMVSSLKSDLYKFKNMFFQKYGELTDQWTSSQGTILNTNLITRLFYFIASAYCFLSYNDSVKQSFIDDLSPYNINMFPYVESGGEFGLNSYLYAVMNGVFLIGFAPRIIRYDLMDTCSQTFTHHDFFHSEHIIKNNSVNTLTKHIYYSILNDQNTSVVEKECHVFVLWFIIHETSFDVFKLYTYRYNHTKDDYIKMVFNGFFQYKNVYRDFDNDLYKFYSKIFAKHEDHLKRYIETIYKGTHTMGLFSDTRIKHYTDDKKMLDQRVNNFRKGVYQLPKSAFKNKYDDFTGNFRVVIKKSYDHGFSTQDMIYDDKLIDDNIRIDLLMLTCLYSFMFVSDHYI